MFTSLVLRPRKQRRRHQRQVVSSSTFPLGSQGKGKSKGPAKGKKGPAPPAAEDTDAQEPKVGGVVGIELHLGRQMEVKHQRRLRKPRGRHGELLQSQM